MECFHLATMHPMHILCSDGKEWKDLRVLHHKQIRPANVHSYSPGINIATDRLLTALESSRNEDGYVEDIFPPVVNWAMEGGYLYIYFCGYLYTNFADINLHEN